ncbi:MAG TPA: glycosyltransferase [Acidimicrobiales bacterium]|nr:glycosyltransferase [Acidimicrobiales bacterium]
MTWDGGGNLRPATAVARRLVGRGHHVGFLGNVSQRDAIESAGCSFRPFSTAPDCDSRRAEGALVKDWEVARRELFGLMVERFVFGPAALYAADLTAALADEAADVVAVDHMLLGALAAAEHARAPCVALWHTVYAPPTVPVPPFGTGLPMPTTEEEAARQEEARRRALAAWNTNLDGFNRFRSTLHLPPLRDVFDQYDRAERVLVMTSPSFDFAALSGARLPANVRYVGPQVGSVERPRAGPIHDPPRILVSLGTTYQDQQPLLRRIVDAVATLPVQALVTTGPAVRLEIEPPANVDVVEWVAHEEVLADVDLVVTHAGLGTVMAGLAHGVPLVCLPIGRDQFDNAARVLHSGAGLRISEDANVSDVARTIGDALSDAELTAKARRLAREMTRDTVGDAAVGQLESIGAEATGVS